MSLKELTELGILLGMLTPSGWKLRYSFEDGDILTEARTPTRFCKPNEAVAKAIGNRLESEGFIPFTTVRKHFLFIQWEVWEEGDVRGACSNSLFKSLVKQGVPCWHAKEDVFFFGKELLVERYNLISGEFEYLPLAKEGTPSQLQLL